MWAEPNDRAARADADSGGPELFIVINPGSGDHDDGAIRDTLAKVFAEAGRKHRFVDIQQPQDLVDASRRAAVQACQCQGVLVAVGGDGTINTVAQAAWQEGCRLGVLPQGTFNLFGREHGIAQDLETAARALLNAQPSPAQVGQVNGRLFLVNSSLGLYPQLFEDLEAFKKQFGRHRWVAVLAGLVTLFEWRRQLRLEIEQHGERARVTTPTLFVGNNRLQLERVGMEPAIASQVGEGRLAALAPKPVGTLQMMWLMLRGAFGRLGDAEQLHSFAFRSLTVNVLGMRKLKVATDGEVTVMTPPLRFAVADKPLVLMHPREEDRVPVE